MSGEVQSVKQIPQLGDSLIIAGQQLAAMSPATIFCPGYVGGFGGFGGPIFSVPGFDAADIYARQKLSDIMFGNCGNTTNSTCITGSGVTNATAANAKITNPADPFSKIDETKLSEMKDKETAIKDKQEEFKKAMDKEEKERLAKELHDLKEEYEKLDKELGNGSPLSKSFGNNSFKFYQNIDGDELTKIKELNAKIAEMKEELAKLDKEGVDLENEKRQIKAQLGSKAGMFSTIDDQTALNNMSPEKRDRYNNVSKEREEKIKDIEKNIKELKSYIEKAAKDENTANFYTHLEERAEKAENDAKSGSATASQAKKALFENGKLRSKEDVISSLSEGKTEEKDNIQKVVDILYSQASEGMEEKDFKETLKTQEFFKKAIGFDKETEDGKKQAILLVKMYDNIMGTNDAFKTNGEKHGGNIKLKTLSMAQAAKNANKSSSGSASSSSSGKTEGAEEKPQESNTPVDVESAREDAKRAIEDASKINPTTVQGRTEKKRAIKEANDKQLQLARAMSSDLQKRLTEFYSLIDTSDKEKGIEEIEKMEPLEIARLVCENPEDLYKNVTECQGTNNVKALGVILKKLNKAADILGLPANQRFHKDGGFYDTIVKGIDNITNNSDNKDIGDAFTSTCGIYDGKPVLEDICAQIKLKLEEHSAM